ncbi:MAG: prepilin-type N-terminal cleavage/methylation domain-containing protein [Bacilli bacterium]|nr:prepilin-type N-terminal cleavage/methylation domain-containing protein [Bacilli bacterium]
MKNGFTLIELLATIIILAIISLIAYPVMTGLIEDNKKRGAVQSAVGYIKVVDDQMVYGDISDSKKITPGLYDVPMDSIYGVTFKGEAPSSGWVEVVDDKVNRYSLVIRGYVISYDGETKTVVKGNEAVKKPVVYPSVVYSKASGGTHVGYPIDANQDMGDKYVWTNINVGIPFNSQAECNQSGGSNEQCVLQNFKTPNLDYKESPDASWEFYLKHTLNSNGVIEEIDVCGKHNGQEFCLERSADGSKYEQNKTLLLNTFGNDSCYVPSSEIYCRDGSDYANANAVGNAYVGHATVGCDVAGGGAARCFNLDVPEGIS